MTTISSTIDIARPPEAVFAYATDPTRFVEWQQGVVSVRMEGADPLRVGSRFATTRRIGRVERASTQQISENSPPTRWAADGVDGPIRPSATVTVEPLGDRNRSRVTIALHFEAQGAGKVLLPMIRRMAAKSAPVNSRRLKERLEAG